MTEKTDSLCSKCRGSLKIYTGITFAGIWEDELGDRYIIKVYKCISCENVQIERVRCCITNEEYIKGMAKFFEELKKDKVVRKFLDSWSIDGVTVHFRIRNNILGD